MHTIRLKDDYIKLGQALKAAGVVESGVDAKFAVQGRCSAISTVQIQHAQAIYECRFCTAKMFSSLAFLSQPKFQSAPSCVSGWQRSFYALLQNFHHHYIAHRSFVSSHQKWLAGSCSCKRGPVS